MSGEFIEFFTELMFGSGAWFGLIIILAIAFSVAYKYKFTSMIFILILIMLNFEYWGQMGGEIAVSSMFMWSVIISYVAIVVMGYLFARDLGIVGRKK